MHWSCYNNMPIIYKKNMYIKNSIVYMLLGGEVAQWLANREIGGSSLTVSTDDPLG